MASIGDLLNLEKPMQKFVAAFIGITLVTASLFAVNFLTSTNPAKTHCHCKGCKCTPANHCGCYSKTGCHCAQDCQCGAECSCNCGKAV